MLITSSSNVYTLDFILDPIVIVHVASFLCSNPASFYTTYTTNLQGGVINDIKDVSNAPNNLSVIPIEVWEAVCNLLCDLSGTMISAVLATAWPAISEATNNDRILGSY